MPSAPYDPTQPSLSTNPTGTIQSNSLSSTGMSELPVMPAPPDIYSDDKVLLDLFEKIKHECMEYRWIFEREWQRDLYYLNNRQWITYHSTRREWVDKRLHKWVPRPVTNKMSETLTAIRTVFAAIDLTAKVRPVGNDPKATAAASVADQIEPLISDEHSMSQVLNEADFWLISTGSVLLQLSWDNDVRFNRTFVQNETCAVCGTESDPKAIVDAGNICPVCGTPDQFSLSVDEAGKPSGQWISVGRGKTVALSPFEWAFPATITRFDELPYIIRLRWREKSYYEANFPHLVPKIVWEKTPLDRSLQIFKTLALSNDVGTGTHFHTMATSAVPTVEGVTEYELWMKPTEDYPKGLVLRVIGDRSPILLRNETESLPGPIPYEDVEGKSVFPFAFAQFEQVGGRLYGRSAITPLIQKQDQLNQLDSLIQLIVQRMANPIWLIPEGAGIDLFSGEPGFVMKWNPLAVGGAQAKPERIPGVEIPQSLQAYRQQILSDIEDMSGTYDIIKGQKPAGVEAFSALQLLVERSQSRFTSVFRSRGEMYRSWYTIALELERQFGPEQRIMTVVGPNKSYAFKYFQNAQLQGATTIHVEDGSDMPKTSLGKRAAIEQANALRLIDPTDPDQKYVLLTTFGLADMVPSLNVHVQAALQMQDAFEQWMETREGLMPLVWKPWHNAQIHWAERIKWLNTDKMREATQLDPEIDMLVTQNLAQLQVGMMMEAMSGPGGAAALGAPAQGGGMAMQNSNSNSTSTGIVPSGTGQQAQGQGPA